MLHIIAMLAVASIQCDGKVAGADPAASDWERITEAHKGVVESLLDARRPPKVVENDGRRRFDLEESNAKDYTHVCYYDENGKRMRDEPRALSDDIPNDAVFASIFKASDVGENSFQAKIMNLLPKKASATVTSGGESTKPQQKLYPGDHPQMVCDAREPLLCVDLCNGIIEAFGIDDGILRPNVGLTVIARGPKPKAVAIKQDGQRGLTRLRLRQPNVATGQLTSDGVVCGQEVKQQFVPRKAGPADVTITLLEGDKKEAPVQTITVELEVESTDAGAIRLGLAPIFGPGVDERYIAISRPGESQNHIFLEGKGPADLELVVGFAPFVESIWGGRGYSNTKNITEFPFGFSPYVGIGALSAGANGVDALKSLHLGLEWEMTQEFAVAVTVVGRRVNRLAPGVAVGMPIESTADIPLVTPVEFGAAIVISLSPDFLRFAQSSFTGLAP